MLEELEIELTVRPGLNAFELLKKLFLVAGLEFVNEVLAVSRHLTAALLQLASVYLHDEVLGVD